MHMEIHIRLFEHHLSTRCRSEASIQSAKFGKSPTSTTVLAVLSLLVLRDEKLPNNDILLEAKLTLRNLCWI